MSNLKVAIYLRTATYAQAISQKERALRVAQENGYSDFTIYEDIRKSGLDPNRPQLQNLLNDIQHGNIRAVIVADPTCLSRDYPFIIKFEKQLEEQNIPFLWEGKMQSREIMPPLLR